MGYRNRNYSLYKDSKGKTFVKIQNFWALNIKMRREFGRDWRKNCIGTYGYEQLFENQYLQNGKKKETK